jgi:cellulose synthase/poly-beta-1,6-N-acetylglucosamine synthase-like glycosyltransferase/glycosyltransferase involved in cell wall biosynthesis/O-antigen/teichoic acid export membrane protein
VNKPKSLSLVIPVYNELKNVAKLLERISDVFERHDIDFELIFVDDHSTDGTYEYLQRFARSKHVTLLEKKGKPGKSYSLIEGFAVARHEYVGMIDADLQYPPEALPEMIGKLATHDIVVANRKKYKGSPLRRFMSRSFKSFFGNMLFGLSTDIQSGLKVFRKEVVKTILFEPKSGWSFDLEFLHRSREAGYKITDVAITFEERENGNSHVKILKTVYEIGSSALALRLKKIHPQIIKPTNGTMIGAGIGYKKQKYITHTTLPHHLSAMQTFLFGQKVFLFALLAVIVFGLITNPLQTGIITVAVLSTVYFIDVLFNLYIILKSLYSPQEISVSPAAIDKLKDSDLPVYTILCPLYKEAHVIPHFLEAIDKIDWPKDKLDVVLLLEEDDPQAKFVVEANSPSYVRAVIVPHSMPKTKPKACNYGLSIARGEYLVIYDAEDIPDPDQLKKAYAVFQKQPKEIVCLQAKLNYYNPHHNLLTRFFTAEYSLWFDLTLPGYQSLNTSLPLGGTSNHFRTKDLRTMEGWDPFNVTEDADLGVRLFRKGYRTAIIDSTTLEEANSNFKNWIRQRSRWIKGYMQTYLVQMRSSFTFAREQRHHALLFQLTVGGKLAFILINPFLWVTTIAYFTLYQFVGPSIEAFYPPLVFYMAVISLVFGNFLFLYYYMIGCARREQWALMKYVFLIPLYWLMISIAGFMAFFQLLFKPHYWEKTIHGLHLKANVLKVIPDVVVATEEVESITIFPKDYKKSFVRRILSSKQFFGGSFLVVASVLGNLGNLFFSTYFGRVLDPATLSIVALVGSFWSIAAITLNAVGATTNYRAGFLDGRYGKETAAAFWSYIRKRTFRAAVLISILWVALSPFLVNYFQAESIYPFLVFLPVWLLGFAYFVDHGYLSGRLMFGVLGVIVILEVLIKVVLGLLIYQFDPAYVYLSVPLSFVASFFIGWALVVWKNKDIVHKHVEEVRHFPKKFFLVSVLTGLSTMSFLTLDFILAKHYLVPDEAGTYALLSTVGKMVFFLGSLGNQFILPLVSHDEGAKKNSRKTFYYVLIATFLLSGSGFLAFGLFGSIVLTQPFLFGERVVSIIPYLIPFTFAMLCFTVSRAFVTYYLAKKAYLFPIVSSVLALLQFGLISYAHDSIQAIVASMLIVGGLNLVLMITMHIFEHPISVIESNLLDFFGLFAKEDKKSQKKGMRILIFNWRDTKHVWAGGAEVYIHELAKRWVKDGSTVTMFCGNDTKHARSEVVDGVHIVRRGGFYTVYLWAFLYYVLRFRGKYDTIIDCENGIPFFTPLYAGIPVVLLIHHIHQDVFRKHLIFPLSVIAQFAEAKMMPLIYKHSTVVTVSESSQKAIAKMGLAKQSEIHIVHNGVDHNDFERLAKQEFPLFSYVGRLKPYKNIDVAIKAFAKVVVTYPFAKLVIVGDGEAYPSLAKLVKELGLSDSVRFTGRVTDRVKVRILSMSWAMLQPSMVEGWGITVIEANASGTPVIASDVSGLRDAIVDKKTGMLVQLGNVDAFAGAIMSIIENTKLRQAYAREAFIWSKSFDWDESAVKFGEILRRQQKKKRAVVVNPVIAVHK